MVLSSDTMVVICVYVVLFKIWRHQTLVSDGMISMYPEIRSLREASSNILYG